MKVIAYSDQRAMKPDPKQQEEMQRKKATRADKILYIIICIILSILLIIIIALFAYLFILKKQLKKQEEENAEKNDKVDNTEKVENTEKAITTNKPTEIEEQCETGGGEKCKTCDNTNKINCLTCNYGYYLPLTSDKKKCISCNQLEHCLNCYTSSNNVLCSECETNYILKNNKCEKKEEEVPDCTTGSNEKCKTCNSNPKLKNQCQSCNSGYYLPSDGNKLSCQSCGVIQNCIECTGTINSVQCSNCNEGFFINNNRCDEIKGPCTLGTGEKCTSCKTEIGKEDQCSTCNEGYFIPDNTNPTLCSKCTTENCKTCSGPLNGERCYECKDGFIPAKASYNDLIFVFSCNCPDNLRYSNGECIEYENKVEIIHDTTRNDFANFLLNDNSLNLEDNQIEVYVNDSLIEVGRSGTQFVYQFQETGPHKVIINMKKKLKSLFFAFTNGGGYFKSFKILPGFDSSQVTSMDYFLHNTGFDYCDLKYLNTSKVYSFKSFLQYSFKLTSLDLSNFDTSRATNMVEMFAEDKNLQMLDLSSFDTSNIRDCKNMFSYFSRSCTIKISNKFTKCREQIRFDNNIINIDDLACNNIANCKSCGGSHETLSCVECKTGYQLKNGLCTTPTCSLGANEKCSKCQTISGRLNECLECNEGYYMSSSDKTKCVKCNIDGCKTCDSSSCSQCKTFYQPIMSSGNIIQCRLTCDLGNGNKCLTCNLEEGKTNQCGSCNEGYILVKNGTCHPIENSLTAIFKLTSTYSRILIMCREENEIELSDFDMYVNGTKVTPYYMYQRWWRNDFSYHYITHDFPSLGVYEVKIIFKKTQIDMQYLFHTIKYLTSVKFSETFDSSHVLNMKYLFSNIDSLEEIDITSLNTTVLSDLGYGFNDVNKLTSLDLSSFTNTNLRKNIIILNSIKLKYIDISSFDLSGFSDISSLISNVSAGASIVINKKYSSIQSRAGYTFIYKE